MNFSISHDSQESVLASRAQADGREEYLRAAAEHSKEARNLTVNDLKERFPGVPYKQLLAIAKDEMGAWSRGKNCKLFIPYAGYAEYCMTHFGKVIGPADE